MQPQESPDIHPRAQSHAGRQQDARKAKALTPDTTCTPEQLHVCFNCAGELVYPLDWSEEGLRHWRIVLRCPECESRREGVFEQASSSTSTTSSTAPPAYCSATSGV